MSNVNLFKKWRNQAKISQQKAAELFGVTQACISRWENNVAQPEIVHAKKLIFFLGGKTTLEQIYSHSNGGR